MRESVCVSAWLFEAQNTRPISLRCHHSAPVTRSTLTFRCCTSASPRSVTSEPFPLAGPSGPSDGYVPCRDQRTWDTWKSYSWPFFWDSSGMASLWVKKRNIMADLHFHRKVRRESKGRKEWFECRLNLIYSNSVMAEMDSRVLYGPCLVVLLTTGAKSRVTGSALGQLGSRAGKMESWELELAQPGRERLAEPAARNWGLYGTTDCSGYLPPTKALNMQYKPTHKQTNKQIHTPFT